GVLDVVAAEQDLKEGAPTSITDVFEGRGDLAGLRRLVEKAKDGHFVAIDKAAFGPCVTHPEKIVCVGLNYRKHAAETGNPVPKAPILFNKFNTALNHHGGVIGVSEEDAQKFDYAAELVIVNGEVRQSSNTSDMVFNCKQLVSYAARYFTLKPGDLIFTGTPEGVISGYPKDKQIWLKAGDKLVTSIEKLGDLEFKLA